MIYIGSIFNRKCYRCKGDLTVEKGHHKEIVFYDNQFYHKQCFVNQKRVSKTCAFCNKNVDLDSENKPPIYFDGHFFHYGCFVKLCNYKKTKKFQIALEYIDKYIEDAVEQFKKIEEKRKIDPVSLEKYKKDACEEIAKWYTKADVNDFIRKTYNVKTVPFPRLNQVYKGEYKGLDTPIPPEDLLDMWKRKINYLNGVYQRNITKGKTFTQSQRISYDLAILVQKYDSYLAWKEEQKILQQSQEEKKHEEFTKDIATATAVANNIKESDTSTEVIDNIVDEIFD